MCIVLQNPHVAGDDPDVLREGIPQPVGNFVVQGEMPRYIDAPNYNAANYYYPPPPVSDIRWCDMGIPF